MANHYVDSAAAPGGDGSIETPWDTIADVNAHSFSGDDFILFKRGSLFREALTVGQSGTDGHPITYTAYGEGALPKFYGSTQVSAWTDEGSNIWYATCDADPLSVWFVNADGTIHWGEAQALKAGLDAEYEWWWDDPNNRLYVYAASDPDARYTSIEKSTLTDGINLSGKDYITISYLDISFFGTGTDPAGIFNQSAYAEYPVIEYCNIHHIGRLAADPNPQGNGILLKNTNNALVRYNTVYHTGRRGICIFSDGATHTSNNNVIEHNTVRNSAHAGIDIFLGDDSAQVDGTIIRFNTIYLDDNYHEGFASGFNVHGILLQTGAVTPKLTNSLVCYNLIYNLTEAGISPKGCNGVGIYNNTVYGYHADAAWAPGIVLYGDSAAHANNAVTIKNNICSGNLGGALYVYGTNTNTVSDNNCWDGGAGTYVYNVGTSYHSDDQAAYRAATGWDANGLWEDPDFTDAEGRDFSLKSTSPCINAGADVGLAEDIVGNDIW